MAAPFTITSVSNYNSNPPSDDGAQTASNRVQWSTQKTKLSDPIKTAFDTSETNTSAAFGKVKGGAGITTTAVSYTVTASDQGKTINVDNSGVTITTPDATVVGSPFVFSVLNNSAADITFAGNGTQTIDGSASFTIPSKCGVACNTDGSNWFTDGQNFNNVLSQPQGYLTLTSGTPIISGDVVSATTVYYTPYVGDRVPISTDGASFKMRQFSELALTLVANHLASTIYDVFLFDNSGALGIATGPAWNNSAAGAGARGTGAGTTELQRVHGLWTNKNSMTARNGAGTYTVAANQGLYVGSIFIDGTAGQVSAYRSYGQSRKFGFWNAYNRQLIYLKAGDSTASWTLNNATGLHNANTNSANSLTVFSGLPEEVVELKYTTRASGAPTTGLIATLVAGIGFNSTTSTSGNVGSFTDAPNGASYTFTRQINADYLSVPWIGINTISALETSNTSTTTITVIGQEGAMLLSAQWRG